MMSWTVRADSSRASFTHLPPARLSAAVGPLGLCIAIVTTLSGSLLPALAQANNPPVCEDLVTWPNPSDPQRSCRGAWRYDATPLCDYVNDPQCGACQAFRSCTPSRATRVEVASDYMCTACAWSGRGGGFCEYWSPASPQAKTPGRAPDLCPDPATFRAEWLARNAGLGFANPTFVFEEVSDFESNIPGCGQGFKRRDLRGGGAELYAKRCVATVTYDLPPTPRPECGCETYPSCSRACDGEAPTPRVSSALGMTWSALQGEITANSLVVDNNTVYECSTGEHLARAVDPATAQAKFDYVFASYRDAAIASVPGSPEAHASQIVLLGRLYSPLLRESQRLDALIVGSYTGAEPPMCTAAPGGQL